MSKQKNKFAIACSRRPPEPPNFRLMHATTNKHRAWVRGAAVLAFPTSKEAWDWIASRKDKPDAKHYAYIVVPLD